MITKVFNGDYLNRLDRIVQWQEKSRIHDESVSSHSFKVAVLTRVLLEDIFGMSTDNSMFKLECTTFALLHDFDEALLLRDMSHEIKYNDFNGDSIREALNKYVSHIASEEFSEREGDSCDRNPEKSTHFIKNPESETGASWMIVTNITNPEPEVKLFVKLADWLALLHNLRVEEKLGNNHDWVKQRAEYCIENISAVAKDVKEMLTKKFSYYERDFTALNNFINKKYIL